MYIDAIDVLPERIDGAIRSGFRRIKLKAMPGWDLEMLQAVRSTFPRFPFHTPEGGSPPTPSETPLFPMRSG